MDLKWEHGIYNNDFESRNKFKEEIDNKLNELHILKKEILNLKNREYECWDNNKNKDNFDYILEMSLNKVKQSISRIEELKREVR